MTGRAFRFERTLIAVMALALIGLPLLLRGWPTLPQEQAGASCLVAAGLLLTLWRSRPGTMLVLGAGLMLVPLFTGPPLPETGLVVVAAYGAVAAERFGGRARWPVGAACVAYLVLIYMITGDDSPGLLILTAPGYLAGSVMRLRRQTAEELAARGRELDDERALYAELSVRNERTRIAAELHDIVGHALSVMVVQAAAGQRLVATAPEAARDSLEIIAASARQGRADLQRLVDLLGGTEIASPDLGLVDEVVEHAARSGLKVTCRLEGERGGVDAAVAHMVFRVVQESLTNALRHAPGAAVRVLVRGESGGRALRVRVENDAPPDAARSVDVPGMGGGLRGLAQRVLGLGGTFAAGPDSRGGWWVEAHIPPLSSPEG